MVFGLDAQVLKDGIGPESFHVVPVLDLSVPNRVVDAISWTLTGRQSLVANEEIQVLRATLRGEVGASPTSAAEERGFVCDGRAASGASSTSGSLGCNCSWEDERGRVVTGETYQSGESMSA